MQASYTIESWQETPISEDQETKLTRAEVTKTHSGQLVGNEAMTYTIAYADKSRSVFSGTGIFQGELNGVPGTYAIIERGSFHGDTVQARFAVYELTTQNTSSPLNIVTEADYTATGHGLVAYRIN
ncbi:DUF3224 domain-containing protein [Polycladidibacter hongkongensis]|uniref:DUF3224 domain-containing protein n=1 Tax=Polycladidibacter hongkongensis TaxID=1647556 RepID=UPI0008331F55|nr:DUF3224 domain-containing protein [Pseudovibrio hongkongensis]